MRTEVDDEEGETIQYFSGQRVVLINSLHLEGLDPGNYKLQIEVTDRLTDQQVSVDEQIKIADRAQTSALN